MPSLSTEIHVFDPAVPFQLFKLSFVGVDTWHRNSLLNKGVLQRLPHIKPRGEGILQLSGGMQMVVPVVRIGLQIGNIKIDWIDALLVDEGAFDILLGSDTVAQAFSVGRNSASENSRSSSGSDSSHNQTDPNSQSDQGTSQPKSSVTNPDKEDPEALSLELYPTDYPFDSIALENFLRSQRQLYNILLIANQEINEKQVEDLDALIEKDEGIPDDLRLKISWIDSGSIWVSLKSKSEKALTSLSKIFEVSEAASLEQERNIAEQQMRTTVNISEETRNQMVVRLEVENEKLDSHNIKVTYQEWKSNVEQHLDFYDELLSKVESESTRKLLKQKKEQAILEIADQQLYPMVRNIPKANMPSPFSKDGDGVADEEITIYLPARITGHSGNVEI